MGWQLQGDEGRRGLPEEGLRVDEVQDALGNIELSFADLLSNALPLEAAHDTEDRKGQVSPAHSHRWPGGVSLASGLHHQRAQSGDDKVGQAQFVELLAKKCFPALCVEESGTMIQ